MYLFICTHKEIYTQRFEYKITYHFFYQVFYNKTLFICTKVGNPHPAIFQFIMDNKHVSFKETKENYSNNKVRNTITIQALMNTMNSWAEFQQNIWDNLLMKIHLYSKHTVCIFLTV